MKEDKKRKSDFLGIAHLCFLFVFYFLVFVFLEKIKSPTLEVLMIFKFRFLY